MERFKWQRKRLRDGDEKDCLLRPWFLVSWEIDDYDFSSTGPPSLFSGSSQPSIEAFTLDRERQSDVSQISNNDFPIIDDLSDDYAVGSDHIFRYNDDLFPKLEEQDLSSTAPYSRSGLSLLGLQTIQQDLYQRRSENLHLCDCDGESSSCGSDNSTECSDGDDIISNTVLRVFPDDPPLAARLIHVLSGDYSFLSQPQIRERVGAWREGVTESRESLQPTMTSTSDPDSKKRNRSDVPERDDDEEDEEDGDEDDKRKPKKVKGVSESDRADSIPRLACPFHKKDPIKYRVQFDGGGEATADKSKKTEYRACAGPGFKNIQRLKEHLKRKHYPVQCHRCYTIFAGLRPAAIAELQAHYQLPTPCELRSPSFKEGINDAEWAKLDKKTSNKDGLGSTTVEKWNHIWTVLFPDSELPETPWYDNPVPSGEPTLPNEQARSFLELFKNLLDIQVTQQTIQFAEDSEETRETMKDKVVTLVDRALALYGELPTTSTPTSTSTKSTSSSSAVFSLLNNRRRYTSGMSSTSAPSSAISMDSPESMSLAESPNVTSNPTGPVYLVASPAQLPASDPDTIVPKIQEAVPGMKVVVQCTEPADARRRGGEGVTGSQKESSSPKPYLFGKMEHGFGTS